MQRVFKSFSVRLDQLLKTFLIQVYAPSSPPTESIEKEDDLFGIHNKSYDIDDEKNENKSKRNELVEYEDYLSNLPMEVEPLSKDDFYKERNNSDRGSRPFYYY